MIIESFSLVVQICMPSIQQDWYIIHAKSVNNTHINVSSFIYDNTIHDKNCENSGVSIYEASLNIFICGVIIMAQRDESQVKGNDPLPDVIWLCHDTLE